MFFQVGPPVVTGFGHCCNSEVTEILLALLWSLGTFLSMPHLLIWGLAGSFSSLCCHLSTYSTLSLLIYSEICSLSICQCFALQEKNCIPSLWGSVLKGIQDITGRWNGEFVMLWCRVKFIKIKMEINSVNVVLSFSSQQSFALH